MKDVGVAENSRNLFHFIRASRRKTGGNERTCEGGVSSIHYQWRLIVRSAKQVEQFSSLSGPSRWSVTTYAPPETEAYENVRVLGFHKVQGPDGLFSALVGDGETKRLREHQVMLMKVWHFEQDSLWFIGRSTLWPCLLIYSVLEKHIPIFKELCRHTSSGAGAYEQLLPPMDVGAELPYTPVSFYLCHRGCFVIRLVYSETVRWIYYQEKTFLTWRMPTISHYSVTMVA